MNLIKEMIQVKNNKPVTVFLIVVLLCVDIFDIMEEPWEGRHGNKCLYEDPNETAAFDVSSNLYCFKGFMELTG